MVSTLCEKHADEKASRLTRVSISSTSFSNQFSVNGAAARITVFGSASQANVSSYLGLGGSFISGLESFHECVTVSEKIAIAELLIFHFCDILPLLASLF